MLYFSKIKLFIIYLIIVILSFFSFINFIDNKEDFIFLQDAFKARDFSKFKDVIKIVYKSGAINEVEELSKKYSSKGTWFKR